MMDRESTVLIVDDEVAVTRTLTRQLAAPGRRILTTQIPIEALSLVERETIDVVISDKDMPEMTGLELLGQIRTRSPLTVRVLLTGHPTLDSALSAINAEGVFRYLTKPWEEAELMATIADALARADELRWEQDVRQIGERRVAAMNALSTVDPRLVEVGEGRHVIANSSLTALFDAAIHQRRSAVAAPHVHDEALSAACVDSSALTVADAIASIPVSYAAVGAVLAIAADDTCQVSIEVNSLVVPLVALPCPLGRAVIGRLACLARIDLGRVDEQFGRVQVGGGVEADLMVGYASTPSGPTAELRRLATSTDATPLRQRDDLLGRYRIVDEIGEGATAIVYRALHLALDKPIALKVLRPAEARDPRAVARFLREARLASKIRHPNIVEAIDYGQLADGRPFLAMEVVTWPTLDTRLASGPLPAESAVEIARQISAGLSAAHAVGVIHRDLKPANVFVSDELRVRIGDFGAAKLMGGPALTQEGWTVGTPLYMAPEQISTGPTDQRLDLYALGCILYHMLTGHPPYEGATVRELLMRHLSAPLPELRKEVPPALARVVRRALAKDPDDRPQTAAEFDAELAEAARPGLLDGLRKWLPRNPLSDG